MIMYIEADQFKNHQVFFLNSRSLRLIRPVASTWIKIFVLAQTDLSQRGLATIDR